jgi:sulfite reductase (NADPH) flavoprotein alpha-component
MNQFIPVLPESAPFTPEQRAYLNGFFAGLFSRATPSEISNFKSQIPEARPLTPLTILFGSQTGNAERLAKRLAKEAGQRGFAPTVHEMAKYPTAQLTGEKCLLVVTSTYGEGEPPDNAKAFWEWLAGDAATRFAQTRFSVCALGDSNYPNFCAFGKAVDARMEKLGGTRVHPRMDCDVDYEEPFQKWLAGALAALNASVSGGSDASFSLTPALSPREREKSIQSSGEGKLGESSVLVEIPRGRPSLYPLPNGEGQGEGQGSVRPSKWHPFPARLLTNRRLNGPGSAKDVRHFEIALHGSSLHYEVGDALGVWPQNDPRLVEEMLAALNAQGDEAVPGPNGASISLRDALMSHYEITRLAKPLLEAFAARTGDEALKRITSSTANGELTQFLWGREIIDLLLAHPAVRFTPAEFVGLLRKLQPRLYSISSSPKAHPGEVHLTVSALRYESLGRGRQGVCSTFLADRVGPEASVPVFVQSNPAFRPPGPDAPLIMVGPGTGIAPFRAFLEERRAIGAKGRNWLFFGDQKSTTDFLYREEIEAFQRDGLLTRLDLGWSRDQAEKVYVQHRMLEHAAEFFAWLEAGAHFYVCGDAARMAKDVDAALRQVIQTAGGKSAEKAVAYVATLKKERRYQRDVY